MSGIYGIYRYDGAPVDPRWLERMKEAMAYYGPDGGGCTIAGPVGMGHLLLEVNPEDAFERQPMKGARGLMVCAARLDNRDALLKAFDISACDAAQVSDGHLINRSFDRWGEEICSHLEGDWAFAAWDRERRRLFLGRDILGRAALYYYEGKGFIAFASSLKALLALPGTQAEPDLLRLAEILVMWHQSAELTAYKGFRSVIGAHLMTFTSDGQIDDRRFWSPEGREPFRFKREEEYVDGFLEHYDRAVRSCLRTRKPVAAELSGGRDSGSVVAMAAPILSSEGRELLAFTSVPSLAPDGAGKGRIGNEWELARATAIMAGANVNHIPIDARDYGVIAGVEHVLDMHDGPGHPASNYFWLHAIMEACSQRGVGVLLVGEAGNFTVSYAGNGSVLRSMLQGQPATALQLFMHGEPNPLHLLKRQVLKPLLAPARRHLQRLKTPLRSPWQAYSALNVQMAKQLHMDRRMRKAGYDPTFISSGLDDLRDLLYKPECGTSCSVLSEVNAWHSVTRLDPAANHALLEFLLRVPDEQYYRHGQRSFLFKRAFENRMPREVVFAQEKGLQSADLGHRIVRELPIFEDCLQSLESIPEAREMLDLPLLRQCLAEVVAKVDPVTTERAGAILVRGIGVGLFLRRLARSRC
ncbi:MAG: asparagine synthase-related protein [Terracidiphilus sp.]